MPAASSQPDYGIDAPGVVRTLLVIGVLLLAVGRFIPPLRLGPVTVILEPSAIGAGFLLVIEGILMIVYSK